MTSISTCWARVGSGPHSAAGRRAPVGQLRTHLKQIGYRHGPLFRYVVLSPRLLALLWDYWVVMSGVAPSVGIGRSLTTRAAMSPAPNCKATAAARWLEARLAELLLVPYFPYRTHG